VDNPTSGVHGVSGSVVGTTDSQTLTNKTIDGDLNSLSDIATSSLKTRTGSDAYVVTGTKGTSNYLAKWDANGDIINGPVPPSGAIVGTTDSQTLSNKSISGDSNTLSNISVSALKYKTGIDSYVVTGTKGTSGNLMKWDANGDAINGPTPPSGAIVGISDTQTLTNKRVTQRTGSTTSTSSLTIASNSYDAYKVTALAGSMTVNVPSGTPTDFQKLWLTIKDNGTSRALTWSTSIKILSAVALPTATTAGKTHVIGLIYFSSLSAWVAVASDIEV
jgi:hypothetical protein